MLREKFNTETHVFLLHGIKIGKKLSKTHKFSEKTLLSDIWRLSLNTESEIITEDTIFIR
jgi:hypothetical protein